MIKLVKASFTYQKQYRLTIRWLRKHNSGTIIRYPIFNISELQKNERNSWCCPFVFWHIASQTQPSEVFSTTFRTLLKSDFGLGVLLCICCIFSDDLFLRLPLEKCFCTPLMLVSRHFFVKANFPTFLVVLILCFTYLWRTHFGFSMIQPTLPAIILSDKSLCFDCLNQCF